jgi:hypothetical protein
MNSLKDHVESWSRVTCDRCGVVVKYSESRKLGWSKMLNVLNNTERTYSYRCTRCEAPKTPRPVHPFNIDPELEKKLETEIRLNATQFSNRWKDYVDSMENDNQWLTVIKTCELNKLLSAYWHRLAHLDGKTPLPDDRTRAVFQRVEKELFGKTVEED